MRDYLDILAASKAIPVTGTDLIAESVMRVYGAPLGIQMLKMSVEKRNNTWSSTESRTREERVW